MTENKQEQNAVNSWCEGGKLNRRREGKAIKTVGERLWSDRDNIRNRSVSTLSLSLCTPASSSSRRQWQWCCQTKLEPASVFLLHLPHLPSWLHSPAHFSNASLFFLGFSVALFLPVALERQPLPGELWISKRLYAGILPTPGQPLLPLSPALFYGSSHANASLNNVSPEAYMGAQRRLTMHPTEWLRLCNLLSSGTLIKKRASSLQTDSFNPQWGYCDISTHILTRTWCPNDQKLQTGILGQDISVQKSPPKKTKK